MRDVGERVGGEERGGNRSDEKGKRGRPFGGVDSFGGVDFFSTTIPFSYYYTFFLLLYLFPTTIPFPSTIHFFYYYTRFLLLYIFSTTIPFPYHSSNINIILVIFILF